MENKERMEISYVIEMVKRETVIAKGINNTRDNVNLPIDLVLVLIEQAERAEYINIWSERVRKYKEQNNRYRGALKQISQYGDTHSWQASQARQALEESE